VISSQATKVVCIGVSRYRREDLRLAYAADKPRALAAALTASAGCAIPVENLRLLTDDEATVESILGSIAAAAGNCTEDDILIVFFSGHGEREKDIFFLLPVEAESDRLSATAVSATQLRDALGKCQARGVLIILDCCRSAGFAENADSFFRTLGSQEFRILLSASRAGQNSYEFKSQSGTIFSRRLTEATSGNPTLGDRPGVIYFSDLFAFLQKQLAEDLETLGYPSQAQEVVFAGTYSRDPRLFILRQVTLDAIEAQTPRYSQKFVTRSRRRAVGVAATVLLLRLGFYYYYLDHSLYIATATSTIGDFEGDYVAVLAGDPHLNAFGFPHLRDTTDLPALALPNDSILAAAFGSDIYGKLSGRLSDDWNAVMAGWK
jgi:uncharacterized caspase-like protein